MADDGAHKVREISSLLVKSLLLFILFVSIQGPIMFEFHKCKKQIT